MKRLFFVIMLLLLTACQNGGLVISNQGNVNEEVMLVDNYNINIPIATTTKISSLEVLNLNGINTENLEYEIDYYLDNSSKTKGCYSRTLLLHANGTAQAVVNFEHGAVVVPFVEIVAHGSRRREVVRNEAPVTASTVLIHQSVDHTPQTDGAATPTAFL